MGLSTTIKNMLGIPIKKVADCSCQCDCDYVLYENTETTRTFRCKRCHKEITIHREKC